MRRVLPGRFVPGNIGTVYSSDKSVTPSRKTARRNFLPRTIVAERRDRRNETVIVTLARQLLFILVVPSNSRFTALHIHTYIHVLLSIE